LAVEAAPSKDAGAAALDVEELCGFAGASVAEVAPGEEAGLCLPPPAGDEAEVPRSTKTAKPRINKQAKARKGACLPFIAALEQKGKLLRTIQNIARARRSTTRK
jgi:hypothetical protein